MTGSEGNGGLFNARLDGLLIREKLLLLLVPLLLMVLLLSANVILDRWQQYRAVRQGVESQQLIQLVSNFIYVLQLERGASAGYIGSAGREFVQELPVHRKAVDIQLSLLREFLQTESLSRRVSAWKQSLDTVLQQTQELGSIRASIDRFDDSSNYFQYFSDINARILYLTQQITHEINDARLLRYADALGKMLWMQEYAGRERALMSQLLALGRVDISTARIVQSHISRQDDLLGGLRNNLEVVGQAEPFARMLHDSSIAQVAAIREVVNAKVVRNEFLSELYELLGYGGLIDEFRSHRIEDVRRYEAQFQRQFARISGIITRYRMLPGTSEAEAGNLDVVEAVLKQYREQLRLASPTMTGATESPLLEKMRDIDHARVLVALRNLRASATEIGAMEWFQAATRRITLMYEISKSIGADMDAYARSAMAGARSTLALVAAILLLAFLLTIWITFTVTRNLTGRIDKVNRALQRVTETGDMTVHLNEYGTDEISMMKRSFNSMLEGRRRIEQELLRSQQNLRVAKEEADTANRAKSEFLARMSHELRTPLNAILGFAQLLELEESIGPAQKDEIKEILKAGLHLLDLINDVLDLARIESGRMVIQKEPVDCVRLVCGVLDLIRPLAKERAITIENTIPADAHLQLVTDPKRLKEVLLNLLSNAIKYNREGGFIRVEAEITEPDRLRISVTDSGAGLSEDQIQQLFQPFERLGAENSAIEGSGIGLVICNRIAESLGGALGVRSQVGTGSTFWIEVSRSGEAAHDEGHVQQECGNVDKVCSQGAYMVALYIEDNPSSLRLMEHIFSRHTDITLLTAMTPEAGLELVTSHRPRLIFLDINLPGMNGLEVLEKIRQSDAAGDTRIVALSANAMPYDIEKMLAAGFDDYLTKPIHVAGMMQLIRNHLHLGPHTQGTI